MGYQEAFRPIGHLAESAGIKRAIEEYKDNPHLPEYCLYACTAREKSTGRLFACIIGQRCRVTLIAGIFLDFCIPDDGKYSDYYEDLDEKLVEVAASERPDLAEKGYREAVSDFERGVEREIERERALREKALQLWPRVSKLLLTCGPMSEQTIASHPMFEGHFMWNALADLRMQGLLVRGEGSAHDALRLSDKALQELGVIEVPEPKKDEKMIMYLLSECGPLSTATLSGLLDTSTAKVLSMLHRLMDEEMIVPVGRGRSRKYQVSDKRDDEGIA